MVFVYVMAGITAFFALILSLQLSVRVCFDSEAKDEMKVFAKIGFYKIHILPAKEKKPKKIKKPAKIKKAKKIKKIAEPPKEKKKYAIGEIFDLIREIGTVLAGRFKKHFKVKIYKINVILAGDEAEKTAMLYGGAIQSACYLHEFLNRNFKIRKKTHSVKIIPDFSKNRTSCNIDIKFSMRTAHMTAMGIASLIKFLKFWKNPKKTTNIS
ncbi:MAG: DUF2953 domain-containing protein [Oscillospiraceae bacterium]|nr:DUF2953 domain-containing protein [Oscillospiraceae bacterium]